jgi:hypothetical protein
MELSLPRTVIDPDAKASPKTKECYYGRLRVNLSTKLPHAIDRHPGDGARMRPKTLGMTQKKLGDALRLTFQQIQKYEKAPTISARVACNI